MTDFGPLPAPLEIPWVPQRNSPRTICRPTAGTDVNEFVFEVPATGCAKNRRAMVASCYGPGQNASRVLTLSDSHGNVICKKVSTSPTFTVVVGPTEHGFGWVRYGVNAGEKYFVRHELENTDYVPPLDFYIDFNHDASTK